jgi:hypothetical protein
MLVRMLLALGGAGIADFGAEPAERRRKVRATAHEHCRFPTDRRTVDAEPGAFGLVAETCLTTELAFLRALNNGFDPCLMLLVCHGLAPLNEFASNRRNHGIQEVACHPEKADIWSDQKI